MNGSIYTGASGLLSYQQGINIESNNVANVNTVGFKSDTVSFNDLMYQDGVGKGVTNNEVLKNFKQGNLVPSNSEYDFAIQGEGFFTLQDPDTPDKLYYTRTGQFLNNKDNFLANSNDLIVMGVRPVVTGDMITSEYENNITSTLVDTDTSIYTLNTYTTDYTSSAKAIKAVLENIDAIEAYNAGTATVEQEVIIEENPDLITNYTTYNTEVTTLRNLVSGDNLKTVDNLLSDIDKLITNYSNALKAFALNPVEGTTATKAQTSITFPKSLGSDGSYTLEVFVNGVKVQQDFDTDMDTTLKLFSDQISAFSGITSSVDTTTGELTISSLISGNDLNVTKAQLNDKSQAITEVTLGAGSGESLINALYTDLQTALAKVGASAVNNKSEIVDTTTGINPSLETIVLDLNELGLSSVLYEKLLSGATTDVASYPEIESEDGNIYLTDGDARFLVGQLLPVTFTNVSELEPQGDNVYIQGVDQADPMYIEGASTVHGKYLENSNIDLSETLVNLMVWQRAFDANSKTVTTSDELLQTALALKNN